MGYGRGLRWMAVLLGLAIGLLQAQGLDTLFVDDFNDGDISDWSLVQEVGGQISLSNTTYHSAPFSLYISDTNYTTARATSPYIAFPRHHRYRVTFWFEIPSANNTYLVAFDNGDVFLMVRGDSLFSASHPAGTWAFVTTLSTGVFHQIELRVDLLQETVDHYVDGTHYLRQQPWSTGIDSFHVGFHGDGKGEGYWDDFCITTWPVISVIGGVPDRSQPPQSGTCCWSVPFAGVNLMEHWQNIGLTPGILDSWSAAIAADSLGWFLGTNGTGSNDRENNPGNPWKGTLWYDVLPGLSDFAGWGGETPDTFDTPWEPTASKTEWEVQGHSFWEGDFENWLAYRDEIEAGYPAILMFYYWNPGTLWRVVYDSTLQESVYFYSWGPYVDSSVTPREYWNGEIGTGHGVTGVGYYDFYDPDANGAAPCTSWVLVHDTWSSTPRTLAIPWANVLALITARPRAVLAHPPLEVMPPIWKPPHPPFYSDYTASDILKNTSDSLVIRGINVDFVETPWGFWITESNGIGSDYVDSLGPGEQIEVFPGEELYQWGLEDSTHLWEVENLWVYTHEFQVVNPHTGEIYPFEEGPIAHHGRLTAVVDSSVHSLTLPVPVENNTGTTCSYQVSVIPQNRAWTASMSPSTCTLTPESTAVLYLTIQRTDPADTAGFFLLEARNLTLPDTQQLEVQVRAAPTAFYDDFTDCDLTGWTVDTAGGGQVSANGTENYLDPPCALEIFSAPWRTRSAMRAVATSPSFSLPDTTHYTLEFYVYLWSAQNFTLVDNHHIHLIARSGWRGTPQSRNWVDLFVVGDSGSYWLGGFSTYSWHLITCLVYPDSQTFRIFIDGYFQGTEYLSHSTMYSYLQMGDFSESSRASSDTISGIGWWDRIRVLPHHVVLCSEGDLNGDDWIDGRDVEILADYLFYNGPRPPACADMNEDGRIDPLDLVVLSTWLYGKKRSQPGALRLAHGPLMANPGRAAPRPAHTLPARGTAKSPR